MQSLVKPLCRHSLQRQAVRRWFRPAWEALHNSTNGATRMKLLAFGVTGIGAAAGVHFTSKQVVCETNQTKAKVAVYGGAFDPITNAHLTCAAEILHSGVATEVWLLPCGPRPDKPGLKTSAMDRYCMCEIGVNTMFTPRFPVRVCDAEVFEPEAMFTYDMLCFLRERYPDKEFLFVIGSDWLQPHTNISSWPSKNWAWKPGDPEEQKMVVSGHKLLHEFEFVVIRRPGYKVQASTDDPTGLKKFGPRMTWLEMQDDFQFVEGNLSATEIRKRLKTIWQKSKDGAHMEIIDGLVPPGVLSFIVRKGLYTAQGSMK